MNNKKFIKISSVLFIVIFISIISVPLIFINKNPEKISIIENKKLASFPKLTNEVGGVNNSFLSEFETYINDNLGFKEEVLVGDIAITYNLFKKLKIPNYIKGEDDNLFYTTNGADIVTLQGRNLFSDYDLEKLSDGYLKMKNFFENSGASFYMMTIPNKEGVYPELYTKEVKDIATETRVDKMVTYIQDNTDINIFNMKQALINNKGNNMLYYKNYDCTHWNMNGAFIGYTEIMNRLSDRFPNMGSLNIDDFNVTVEKSKGSLAHLEKFDSINKAMSFDDYIYNYVVKNGYSAEISIEVPNGVELNANDKYFHYLNKSKTDMPTMLIIGDSYIYSYILPILAENFSEIYFINFKSAKELMTMQNNIKADIVLYEFVERAFNPDISTELYKFIDSRVEKYDINELPIVEDTPVINIDSLKVENNTLLIDTNSETQSIVGWTIDSKVEKLASDLYLKVGESYYKSSFFERPDLISIKEEYLMAGFSFDIPTNELIKSDNIQFIIISNDGTYQYQPVEFNISIN